MSGGRQKGTQKTGGRLAGTPNKATIEIKELARVHGPASVARLAELAFCDPICEFAAVQNLEQMIKAKESSAAIAKFARTAFSSRSEGTCVAAIKELLDRGYGKAPQPHDGDGQGGPMTLVVTTGVPRSDA